MAMLIMLRSLVNSLHSYFCVCCSLIKALHVSSTEAVKQGRHLRVGGLSINSCILYSKLKQYSTALQSTAEQAGNMHVNQNEGQGE